MCAEDLCDENNLIVNFNVFNDVFGLCTKHIQTFDQLFSAGLSKCQTMCRQYVRAQKQTV